MPLRMVDVSGNNGSVNFDALRGCAVVAAKCTELGPDVTYVDPQYARNRAGAKKIGATFLAYHFGHPGVSAAASWEFFAKHATLKPGDLLALDLEVSDGLTTRDVAAWGSAFAHAARGAVHRWPWAYSDQAFIEAGNFDGLR